MNTFYNKKNFSHLVFYDVYFNKKSFYKSIFNKSYFSIYNKYKNYNDISNYYKNYEKMFSNLLNTYKATKFNYDKNILQNTIIYKNNLTHKKIAFNYNSIQKNDYKKLIYFDKTNSSIDYTYNYINSFKGYYDKSFSNSIYTKICKNTYFKNLLQESLYQKLDGYNYFFYKNLKKSITYKNFKATTNNNFQKNKNKSYEKFIKKEINLQFQRVLSKKYTEIDFEILYEKFKEKLFDEVFLMSGGLY